MRRRRVRLDGLTGLSTRDAQAIRDAVPGVERVEGTHAAVCVIGDQVPLEALRYE